MNFANKSFSLLQRDVILVVANLCTGVVIARKLGPELAGLWTILMLLPQCAEAFGRLKFDIAAVYFLGKKKATVGEVTFLLHIIAIVTSIIIVTIFLFNFDWFYNKMYHNSTANMRVFTCVSLAIIPLRMIFLNYSYIFIFQENIYVYNAMIICQAIVNSLFVIVLVLICNLGIFGAVIGNILGLFASIIYAGFTLNKQDKIKPNLNLALLAEMAKYSVYQYISGIVGYFQISITDLISTLYLLPGQLVFFTMSKSLGDVATRMIPAAMNILLFSRISKSGEHDKPELLIARTFRVLFVILTITAVLLNIFIKSIVILMYGINYFPIIEIFRIVITGFVLNQSSTVFASYFSGIGRSDLIAKIVILPLLIQVSFALILIPTYGVNGAAYAFLFSSMVFFIIQIFVFRRISQLSIQSIIPGFADFIIVYKFVAQKIVTCIDKTLAFLHVR